jgi:hypothetical protein
MQTSPSRRLLLASASSLLVLGLAACSSDSTGDATASSSAPAVASSPASGTAAVCADVDAVQAAFDDLASIELLKDGTDALREKFATLETAVRTLADSASSELSEERAAVRTSVDGLKASVEALTDSPSLQDAAALKTSVDSVRTSLTALKEAADSAC